MSDVVKVTKSKIDALGAALRSKMGTEEPLTLQDMIADIPELAVKYDPNAGTYDANGDLLKSWKQLISDGDVTVTNGVLSTPNNRITRFRNAKKVVIDPSVTSIGDYAFNGCSLATITIPNSVTSIGESAFASHPELTTITIPNSVTSIGESAFAACANLTTITFSNGLTSIGDFAFEQCAFTTITIPNSVTSIGEVAFISCGNLTTIHYSGTATGAPWGAENATVVP